MFENILSDLAEIFDALSNEFRLEIVGRLAHEDEVPCEKLATDLPLSRPALSHHVRVLKSSKILKVSRRGQYLYYSLNREYLLEVAPELMEFLEKEAKRWQGK